jgi:hypothetical protein
VRTLAGAAPAGRSLLAALLLVWVAVERALTQPLTYIALATMLLFPPAARLVRRRPAPPQPQALPDWATLNREPQAS